MMKRIGYVTILSGCVCLAQFVHAQDATKDKDKPLDEAVEDVGPLSTSLRDTQKDLRQPTAFEDVYRVPGDEDKLMRVSGGLRAVFPRSQYAATRRGIVPVIPAGTVFQIGEPQLTERIDLSQFDPPASTDRVGERIHARVGLEATVEPVKAQIVQQPVTELPTRLSTPRGEVSAGGVAIISDPLYRQRRMTTLLNAAMQAERSRSTVSSK